ncbi:OPT family oligopeptide transporter [bacterium]|nr:MAG: OPT family oligopeptide transporter [bacterium]
MSDEAQLKTVEEQDRHWYENVFKRDVPQLTARAVISGMVFGGLMSLSNLYVGLKSGWGLGVDIVAVILIFSIFKGLKSAGIVKNEFGMMENTIMMTVAVAASWISSAGLVSAVPALSMLTGYEFVWWQLALFVGSILYLGLFMAIPLKRQMIQVERLRFPANIPTAETLKAMYSKGSEAIKKAKALGSAGGLGVIIAGLRDTPLGWIPGFINLPFSIAKVSLSKLTLSLEPSLIFIGIGGLFGIKVGLSMLFGLVLNYGVLAPNLIDAKIIKHPAPQVQAMNELSAPFTVNPGESISVTLEEANVGPEMSSGSSLNTYTYAWTRPKTYNSNADLIRDFNSERLDDGTANPFYGVISVRDTIKKNNGGSAQALFIEASNAVYWESMLTIDENQNSSRIVAALGFEPGQSRMQAVGGFRNISAWSLWPGATVLVVGGLLALVFQWRTLGKTFSSIFSTLGKKKGGGKGILDDIEVPMTWFVPGFLITGFLCILTLTMIFSDFGVHWYMGLIAVLLTFILAAVAARAGAEVGINPIGALGKVTQLTFGAISAGNVAANLMTANITAGAAASCSDTVGNLKVGYMVGAHPRKQFIAQLFGVFAGALLAVPAYFILVPDVSILGGAKFPAPSALIWMGVAKVLAQGISTLPPSVLLAMAIAFVFSVLVVIADRVFPKIRPYTPSPTALGIAMTIPAYTSFAMFLGAFIVWIMEKKAAKTNDMYTIPVASGCIAGESIMGVALAAAIAFNIM